nr:putative metallopeptidase [Duganella sp. BJB475]
MPPEMFADPTNCRFAPAPEVLRWARAEILTEGGQLHNPDHEHLEYADIQFLWAPEGFQRKGRTVLGYCEEVLFRCDAWQKGRQQQQMADWFGMVPQFLITLDARHCLGCSDVEFCALVDHELYHIAQELDEFGSPKFNKYGQPALCMRGHDCEEFIGVVRRYGPGEDVQRLIDAASKAPEVAKLNIARACGTCLLKVA